MKVKPSEGIKLVISLGSLPVELLDSIFVFLSDVVLIKLLYLSKSYHFYLKKVLVSRLCRSQVLSCMLKLQPVLGKLITKLILSNSLFKLSLISQLPNLSQLVVLKTFSYSSNLLQLFLHSNKLVFLELHESNLFIDNHAGFETLSFNFPNLKTLKLPYYGGENLYQTKLLKDVIRLSQLKSLLVGSNILNWVSFSTPQFQLDQLTCLTLEINNGQFDFNKLNGKFHYLNTLNLHLKCDLDNHQFKGTLYPANFPRLNRLQLHPYDPYFSAELNCSELLVPFRTNRWPSLRVAKLYLFTESTLNCLPTAFSHLTELTVSNLIFAYVSQTVDLKFFHLTPLTNLKKLNLTLYSLSTFISTHSESTYQTVENLASGRLDSVRELTLRLASYDLDFFWAMHKFVNLTQLKLQGTGPQNDNSNCRQVNLNELPPFCLNQLRRFYYHPNWLLPAYSDWVLDNWNQSEPTWNSKTRFIVRDGSIQVL